MSNPLEALRIPLVACGLSLLFLMGSYARLAPSARQVAEGTGTGSCEMVPWLRIVGPCSGIVLLELAPDAQSAWRLVDTLKQQDQAAKPGTPGLVDAAISSVRLDYFLIPAYVAFLGFLGMVVVRLAELRGFPRLIQIVIWAVGLQLIAGTLDGIENVGLFTMLKATGPQDIPEWTRWVATVKWWLIIPGLVVPVIALGWVAARGARTADR